MKRKAQAGCPTQVIKYLRWAKSMLEKWGMEDWKKRGCQPDDRLRREK